MDGANRFRQSLLVYSLATSGSEDKVCGSLFAKRVAVEE